MKRIYFMLLSAVLFALAGCTADFSSDNLVLTDGGGDGDGDGDFVYMDIAMQLSNGTGTRSSTDWADENPGPSQNNPGSSNSDAAPDVEEPYDYANTIKTVLLVLAGNDGRFISYSEVTGSLSYNVTKKFYSVKAKFKRADIDAAYAEGGTLANPTDRTVKVYAYANFTDFLHKYFSTISETDKLGAWLNLAGEIEEKPSRAGSAPIINNTIWAKNSFLMTNATEFTATLPTESTDWDEYSDPSAQPYHLTDNNGAITLERVAARIDYRDASKNEGEPNTYHISGGLTSSGGDDMNLIDVRLTRMSLVNMAKKFYYLRRVADDYEGYTDNKVRIGKNETKDNFVVDMDWKDKKDDMITPKNAESYFNFPLYSKEAHEEDGVELHYNYARENWYTDNIREILNNELPDKYIDLVEGGPERYHIWRYVTENTLPDINSQKAVQSTGIVFKGLILPGENINAKVGASEDKRYISENVEKALTASSWHLPKAGEAGAPEIQWDTTEGLNDMNKDKLSYAYPTLYEFDGLLYAGLDEVALAAAEEGQGSLLYAALQNVFDHWVLNGSEFVYKAENPKEDDTKLTIRIYNEIKNKVIHTDADLIDYTSGYEIDLDETSFVFKHLLTSYNDSGASNFTIYEASFEDTVQEKGEGWGYYCYYFYWNRHNDNVMNGKMGPMEFAIVRNNVYKLSVSKINRLGHPRNPDNDPDPFNPDDPDEDSRVYLTVDLKVLPWVVRVNNIEF